MRGFLGARSQFDFGDEDYALCENCLDGSGWTVWKTQIHDGHGRYFPVTMFVACADCNDDGLKPYPAPWPVCLACEESKQFCRCVIQ
jgi:hypothetical protein